MAPKKAVAAAPKGSRSGSRSRSAGGSKADKGKRPARNAPGPSSDRHRGKRKSEEHPAPEDVKDKRRKVEAAEVAAVSHPTHGKEPGVMFTWGTGDMGELVMGPVELRNRPTLVPLGGTRLLQVAVGGMHNAALTTDGRVMTGGVNDEGALGRPTDGSAWAPVVQAGGVQREFSTVMGHVHGLPQGLRAVQLSAGDSHTVALMADGSVWGWGTFRNDGGVMGWSDSVRFQLYPQRVWDPRSRDEQCVQIASGTDHVLALLRNGSVLSWGSGSHGQLGRVGRRMNERNRLRILTTPALVPLKRERSPYHVVEVACGWTMSFALCADGRVLAWGLNNSGQLGIAPRSGEDAYHFPVWVPALAGIKKIASGQFHTLALTADGKLLSFGRPTYGRLGRPGLDVRSEEPLPQPTQVADGNPPPGLQGRTILGLGAGDPSGCVCSDGSLWTWGPNTSFQLGHGPQEPDPEDEPVPRKVAVTKKMDTRRVLSVGFGGQHAGALATAREGDDEGPPPDAIVPPPQPQ